VFTRARHWSLSSARWIQSIQPHPISLRSILILSTSLCLCLPSCLFQSGCPTKILPVFLFTHRTINRSRVTTTNAAHTWIICNVCAGSKGPKAPKVLHYLYILYLPEYKAV
jgi:hypothetical protein